MNSYKKRCSATLSLGLCWESSLKGIRGSFLWSRQASLCHSQPKQAFSYLFMTSLIMFSGWKWWGEEEEEEQEESAKRLKAIFEHLNASNQGQWVSGMITTRKKTTQCCHQSRRTLNAPFTKTAFCVLQGLLVNIYYLVKFSRHATFRLDSLWYKCQFRNTGSFCKKQFMVTILYLQFLSRLHNHKNLIEQNDFFSPFS